MLISSISGSIYRIFYKYRLKWSKSLPINMSSFMFSDTPIGMVTVCFQPPEQLAVQGSRSLHLKQCDMEFSILDSLSVPHKWGALASWHSQCSVMPRLLAINFYSLGPFWQMFLSRYPLKTALGLFGLYFDVAVSLVVSSLSTFETFHFS